MRDIKFRVRSDGHIIGYESFFDGRWHWRTRYGKKWFVDHDGLYKAEGATREQFTGIYDSSGSGIYENDTVRINGVLGRGDVVEWQNVCDDDSEYIGFNIGGPDGTYEVIA